MPGLRQGWFAVLLLIRENPGITPMALSRGSGRDKSTITPMLRDARARGARRAGGGTGRPPQLRAAADHRRRGRGSPTCERAPPSTTRRLDAIVGEQKQALLAVLRRIVAELGEEADRSGAGQSIGQLAEARLVEGEAVDDPRARPMPNSGSKS